MFVKKKSILKKKLIWETIVKILELAFYLKVSVGKKPKGGGRPKKIKWS